MWVCGQTGMSGSHKKYFFGSMIDYYADKWETNILTDFGFICSMKSRC